MIHTLYVSAGTEPAELKKLMRKKLMTGGAVIRVQGDLASEELEQIYERYSNAAVRHNLAAEVLVQLAGHARLSGGLGTKLASLGIPEVSRALESRQI